MDVLHELGHALAIWIQGGSVAGFPFSPFGASYTYYNSIAPNPNLTTWGGMLVANLVGLLLILLFNRGNSSYSVPYLMTRFACLLYNGI